MNTTHTLWGLLDDRPGHANQVRGLMQAMASLHPSPCREREIPLHYNAFSLLPNLLLGSSIRHLLPETKAALHAPWPDMVIACGRRTEPVARWIKRQSPHTILVYIMTPASRAGWDALIIPEHDAPGTRDARIITTHGPLHRITPLLLAAARGQWGERLLSYPAPRIGVMLGDVSATDAQRILERAQTLAGENGSVLISTSRRSMKGLLLPLLPQLTCPAFVHDWHESKDENPYPGILACSDRILVSGDSLSMCVEAIASGVPVHIAETAGLPAKHRAMHRMLFSHGHALRLEDDASTTVTPTNDTLYAAEVLHQQFGCKTP